MKFRILYLLTILSLNAFASTDTRIEENSNSYPAIGRLYAEIPFDLDNENIKLNSDLNKKLKIAKSIRKNLIYNFCTATLIGENNIVTAGHCYEMIYGFTSNKINTFFKPGPDSSSAVKVSSHSIYKFGKFFTSKKINEDWAILKLNQPLLDIKPLRFYKIPNALLTTTQVQSLGYPAIVNNHDYEGYNLFKSTCHFLESSRLISQFNQTTQFNLLGANFLNCPTSSGNSGGPIIYKLKHGNHTEDVIVGILSAGANKNIFERHTNSSLKTISFSVPIDDILNSLIN